RLGEVGLCFGELGASTLKGCLVLAPLDFEQHLALLDLGAFLEAHSLEHTLDARTKLDGLDRIGLRHELRGDRDRLLDDLCDHNGGRGRRGRGALLGLRPVTCRQCGKQRGERQRTKEDPAHRPPWRLWTNTPGPARWRLPCCYQPASRHRIPPGYDLGL